MPENNIFRIKFAIFAPSQLLAVLILKYPGTFISKMYLILPKKSSALQKVSSKGKESLWRCRNVSGRLPNTVNLHVQAETKTSVYYLCVLACGFECFVCRHQWPQTHMHVCFCVCVSTCLVAHLFFLHAYLGTNISTLLASMLECPPVLLWECDCAWCVVRACKTDSVHKWTLDLLGTRWRQANLAYIVYRAFMQRLGWQNVFAHCFVQPLTMKVTSQKDNLSRVLWPFKFKSYFNWKYFLFVSWRRAWTLTLLPANHQLWNPHI